MIISEFEIVDFRFFFRLPIAYAYFSYVPASCNPSRLFLRCPLVLSVILFSFVHPKLCIQFNCTSDPRQRGKICSLLFEQRRKYYSMKPFTTDN